MQRSLLLTPLPRKSTIPCPATGAVRDQPPETTLRREWRSLKVTPNRRWSSRGHYPESPLYCDEDVAGTYPGHWPDWGGSDDLHVMQLARMRPHLEV